MGKYRSLVASARFASRHDKSRRVLACALLLALPFLVGCRGAPQRQAQAPYVATSVASQGTIHPASQLAGIIAPYQNVAIQTTTVEPTDAVYVKEGDNVYRGEVLAQLDTADLRAELASDNANTSHTYYSGVLSIAQGVDTVRQDRVTLRTDDVNLERDESLFRQGYISRQTVDQQINTVNTDKQTLAAAMSNMQANGTISGAGLQAAAVAQAQAEAQQIRVAIQKATIYSPIDGVVVNRNLNVGEYPGSRQIFTLQQVDPIYAIVQGSGAQIAHIAIGAPASVSISDLGLQKYSGRVVGVLNQIVPGSTNFEVKVQLSNPQHLIRPGMTVQAGIALPSLSGIRIPETAFTDQNHTQIMTVNAKSILQIAKVTEVGNDGVTSIVTGIQPGTRVVSNGMATVGTGEKVSLR